MRETGFVFSELYLWHDPGSAAAFLPAGGPVQPDTHAENAETKRRLRNLLEVSGLLDELTPIRPRPATEEELLRVHDPAYVERIRALSSERGGDAGELTPFGPGSYEIALLSAGGVIAAVDAVIKGRVDNAYALVRPPGHHAEPDRGRGFCIFSNAAIAVRHALAARGLERIAVVDWDVHHGNGTEIALYDEPRALTISLHQDRFYPQDTGGVEATGRGAAEGTNLNVPLPPGSGVGAYVAAFERLVVPALHAFRPDLVLVASGFDAGALDPLGRQMLTSEGYRTLTELLLGAADELCGGRIAMCHEGGYSTASVPFLGLAVLEALSGRRTGVEDPFLGILSGLGGQDLQPHQEALIESLRPRVEKLR